MLETSRLFIRLPLITDAENLFELNQDFEVVRYTGDTSFSSMNEVYDLIRTRMWAQFEKFKMTRFIVTKKDGTFLGWCGLKYFPETNEVDLGYRLLKKHWGNGYATEASSACLRYGFNNLNLDRIIAKAMPQNIPSIKIMQKLGMTFRGHVNDPTDPHPFVLYDITREEFNKCAES